MSGGLGFALLGAGWPLVDFYLLLDRRGKIILPHVRSAHYHGSR